MARIVVISLFFISLTVTSSYAKSAALGQDNLFVSKKEVTVKSITLHKAVKKKAQPLKTIKKILILPKADVAKTPVDIKPKLQEQKKLAVQLVSRPIAGELDVKISTSTTTKKASQESDTAQQQQKLDAEIKNRLSTQPTTKPRESTKKIMIRVLLKEFSTEQKITFAIQSNKGFILESPLASGKRARWQHEIINVLGYKHNLFLLTQNGIYKRIKTNELAISSVDGDLKIDNYRYSGTIYLRIDPETKMVQMVNKINLDDYIYSVLRYESLSYWPQQMQEVQAIVSRSYAVRQIKIARSNSTIPFYDIKNNNFHQVYNGNHNSTHLWQAVEATHNLVLTYKGAVALTMFDICCGGVIPAHMKKKDSDKPYLFRTTRCSYCINKSNYEWQCSLNKEKLLNAMIESPKIADKAKKIGTITGISLKEKDRAGIVHRILIHGTKNNLTLTNNEFKSLLGSKARSSAYGVKKLQDSIQVKGYGYGHNMGLCQLGARELVAQGNTYQEILPFYFPKTSIMRLKVT